MKQHFPLPCTVIYRPGTRGGQNSRRSQTMPKMRFRADRYVSILLLAVSGCALMDSSRRQDGVQGNLQPTAFDQILVDRESAALSDVVAILLAKGYALIWDSPREAAAQYQVHPGEVLVMTCSYLGEAMSPAGVITAAVTCTAKDLASGETVYAGRGSFQLHSEQDDVGGAIDQALEKFPRKGGAGRVLSHLPLPPRHTDTPGSPTRQQDRARPPS